MFTHSRRHLWMPLALCAALFRIDTAEAQLTDLTQAPNVENAGIVKSLEQQIGAGVGNLNTPGSSTFITARDPARAIRRGRQLFQRKFTDQQGFGPRPASGNIAVNAAIGAGMIDSCAGCHGRPRGSAGFGGDVVTRPDSRDAPHLFGLGIQEMLGDEITSELRGQRTNAINQARGSRITVTRTLSSKGVTYGQIRAFPDGRVDTSGVVGVDPDLRVKPFFAHGGTTSIREFVVGAFNDEMGLQSPDPVLCEASDPVAPVVTTSPAGLVFDPALDTASELAGEMAEDAAYAPYLERQEGELRDLRANEAVLLGPGFPYASVPGLSNEMVERLAAARPANLAAADYRGNETIFNIGGGSRVTLNTVIDLMGRVTGRTPDARFSETQKGDVMHTMADIALAARELGYAPKIGIEEGIAREAEWLDAQRRGVGN